MTRQIYAAYDDVGIFVYQAFTPAIVSAALEKGTFGAGGSRGERAEGSLSACAGGAAVSGG